MQLQRTRWRLITIAVTSLAVVGTTLAPIQGQPLGPTTTQAQTSAPGGAGPTGQSRTGSVDPNGPDRVVTSADWGGPAKQSNKQWSKKEMTAAKPLPVRTLKGSSPAEAAGVAAPSGTPRKANPGPLKGAAAMDRIGSGAIAPMVSARAQPQATGIYPSPFSSWEWFSKYRIAYVSTVAKVFLTQNGDDFVCSGSVIRPDVVDTAGHCVHTGGPGGSPSTNVVVCPSYDDAQGGVNPQVGCWAAVQLASTNKWVGNSDFDNDFGAIKTDTGGSGACAGLKIDACTSYLGAAWNQPDDQNWVSAAYPAEAPFSGGKIIVSTGEWWATLNGSPGNARSLAQGSNLNGGSSGGPWIIQFGSGWFLNGHSDWKYNDQPLSIQSPRYTDAWAAVIDALCTSDCLE